MLCDVEAADSLNGFILHVKSSWLRHKSRAAVFENL